MQRLRPGQAPVSKGQVLRFLTIGCLAAFASVTILPLFLNLTGLSGPCRLDEEPAWYQSANPFSHYNLCRMKHSMSTTHTETIIPRHEAEQRKQQQQAVQSETDSQNTADQQQQQQEEAKQQQQKQQGETETERRKEQETADPVTADPVSPPPSPPSAPPPSQPAKPPPVPAKPPVAKPKKSAKTRTPAHHVPDDDIDEIEYPRGDEDLERILKWPHYDECNLCKVCIPYDIVKDHPKAKAHKAHKDRHLVPTADPDVTLESVYARDKAVTEGLEAGKDEGGARRLHGRSDSQSDMQAVAPLDRGQGRRLSGDEKDATESDSLYYIKGNVVDLYNIAPGDTKRGPRKHLPNCTVCWGCHHTLEMLAMGTVMAGSYYAHEPGGSPSWLFRVRSNKTRTGWAVAKTWCVPVRKVKQRGLAMCSPKKVYATVKLLLAQNKIIRQCGFNSIAPSMWVEPIVGVIPGHGFRVDWLALWAEIADGTSVQNIQEYGKPRTNPEYMLDLFTNKVNHTDIKMIAMFDVLFSQCDRHQQNIFINENGKVWAIDNDQTYSVAWRPCGFDSMVLPTTQKFMINHLGFFYIMKYPQKDPPKKWSSLLNPLLLLDYRCHVDGGAIGFSYPKKMKQCLKEISSLSVDEIQAQYGYPTIKMAEAIHNRTNDLFKKGFEWTLMYGQPTNQAMHRYKVAPSCCSMTYDTKRKKYECTTPWKQMTDIPFGNPWHGGPWHGAPGKDTGTYEGGTQF